MKKRENIKELLGDDEVVLVGDESEDVFVEGEDNDEEKDED